MTTNKDLIRDIVFEAYDKANEVYASQKLIKKSMGDFQAIFLDCVNEVLSQRELEYKNKINNADFLCKDKPKGNNPCPSCGAILIIKDEYVRCPRRHFCGFKKDKDLYNKSLEPKI